MMVLGMVYGIEFLAHYNTLDEFLLSDDIIGDWCIASPSLSSPGLEQNRPVDREGGAGHVLPDIAW
jgi:hypothetical protein